MLLILAPYSACILTCVLVCSFECQFSLSRIHFAVSNPPITFLLTIHLNIVPQAIPSFLLVLAVWDSRRRFASLADLDLLRQLPLNPGPEDAQVAELEVTVALIKPVITKTLVFSYLNIAPCRLIPPVWVHSDNM